jgi:zinc/manganese transport system permease protein
VAALGTALACGAVWIGLILSAMFNLPPSFAIVTLSCGAWAVSLLVTRDRLGTTGHRRHVDDHHHPRPGHLTA